MKKNLRKFIVGVWLAICVIFTGCSDSGEMIDVNFLEKENDIIGVWECTGGDSNILGIQISFYSNGVCGWKESDEATEDVTSYTYTMDENYINLNTNRENWSDMVLVYTFTEKDKMSVELKSDDGNGTGNFTRISSQDRTFSDLEMNQSRIVGSWNLAWDEEFFIESIRFSSDMSCYIYMMGEYSLSGTYTMDEEMIYLTLYNEYDEEVDPIYIKYSFSDNDELSATIDDGDTECNVTYERQ